jgi:hypothetical protein
MNQFPEPLMEEIGTGQIVCPVCHHRLDIHDGTTGECRAFDCNYGCKTAALSAMRLKQFAAFKAVCEKPSESEASIMIQGEIARDDAKAVIRVLRWAGTEVAGPISAVSRQDFEIASRFCASLQKAVDAPASPAVTAGSGQWDRPDHYGGEENPFEPIKIIEWYGLNFNLGNAVKYILRTGKKKGEPYLKELRKAYTYIGFEIRRREKAGEK